MKIQEWLNGYIKNHLVESFVILDDDEDMAHLAHRLVKTNPEVGLTAEDVERAVVLFGD